MNIFKIPRFSRSFSESLKFTFLLFCAFASVGSFAQHPIGIFENSIDIGNPKLAGSAQDAHDGSGIGPLRLAFLITIVIYNLTESTFDRLMPVWFTLLLVMVECPRPETMAEITDDEPSFAKMKSPQS